MLVRVTGQRIIATQKNSPHAPLYNVNDRGFRWIQDFARSLMRHGIESGKRNKERPQSFTVASYLTSPDLHAPTLGVRGFHIDDNRG